MDSARCDPSGLGMWSIMSADVGLATSKGAEFLKVALQVNPFAYIEKQKRKTKFKDEDSYNKAIVEACLKNGVDLIAVTDHFSVDNSFGLLGEASARGIHAFPGFEAVTSEGIHALCIFDKSTTQKKIERCIGDCGVRDPEDEGLPSTIAFSELLDRADDWDAVVVAAHVTTKGGLLAALDGRPRQQAWTSEKLTAAAISTPFQEIAEGQKRMIQGKIKGYKRDHPVALIYSGDVTKPSDLSKQTTWSWLKASNISIDGLRHAFLDPESRVRLSGELPEENNHQLLSVKWTGGFLDGVTIPLNPALNVIIGPRGSGKSTVLESLRFVLGSEILGDDARLSHEGFVSEVLGSGTEVEVAILNVDDDQVFIAKRAVSGGTTVLQKPSGAVSNLLPKDLLGPAEVFGQHEVAELAKLPARRSRLLDRFLPAVPSPKRSRGEVEDLLRQNRNQIIKLSRQLVDLGKSLEQLPAVQERLGKYAEAGVKDKLSREAAYEHEEPLLDKAYAQLGDLASWLEEVEFQDLKFLSDDQISDLPSKSELREVRSALERLTSVIEKKGEDIERALAEAYKKVDTARARRQDRREEEKDAYLKKLRELKAKRIDGDDYIELERLHARLKKDSEKHKGLLEGIERLRKQREQLLDELYELQDREFERLKAAAKYVSKKLYPTVRVVPVSRGDRHELVGFIRSRVSGQLNRVEQAIREIETANPRQFAVAVRKGPTGLGEFLGIGGKQVENTAYRLDTEDLLEIEEIWLDPTTSIELNVNNPGGKPIWRGLDRLSTGQKATAILMVLLLDSENSAPLVVDQPEDDLDNAFIADDVVPLLRSDKHSRQFVLSTHNPNIPVLGDAELVVRLTAFGEAAADGTASIQEGHIGSLDDPDIRLELERLEGGRDAFEKRRRRYGY